MLDFLVSPAFNFPLKLWSFFLPFSSFQPTPSPSLPEFEPRVFFVFLRSSGTGDTYEPGTAASWLSVHVFAFFHGVFWMPCGLFCGPLRPHQSFVFSFSPPFIRITTFSGLSTLSQAPFSKFSVLFSFWGNSPLMLAVVTLFFLLFGPPPLSLMHRPPPSVLSFGCVGRVLRVVSFFFPTFFVSFPSVSRKIWTPSSSPPSSMPPPQIYISTINRRRFLTGPPGSLLVLCKRPDRQRVRASGALHFLILSP